MLNIIFPDLQGLYIYIWRLDKKSHWFNDINKAQDFVDSTNHQDVYFGLGLSEKSFASTCRIKADDVKAIPGLWLDLDISNGVHKKENIFPSIKEAMQFLKELKHYPNLIVSSGGGLHCYWLFDKLLKLPHPELNRQCQELSYGWQKYCQDSCEYVIDSTFDLARVLRVPGTINAKTPGDHKDVKVLYHTKERYDGSIFQEFSKPIPSKTKKVNLKNDGISTSSEPPEDFDILCENMPEVADTWAHDRPDLKDQSPSSYDMSLASYAVIAGWDDEKIAKLLMAHRNKYGFDLKRLDYYERTIAKAKDNKPLTTEEILINSNPFEKISEILKIELKGFDKVLSEPAIYRLHTNDGIVTMTFEEFTSKNKFRKKVFETINRFPSDFKNQSQFEPIMEALMELKNEIEVSEESSTDGQVKVAINEYLEDCKPQEYASDNQPLLFDKTVYISLVTFHDWYLLHNYDKISRKDLSVTFKFLGMEKATKNNRRMWSVPWAKITEYIPF